MKVHQIRTKPITAEAVQFDGENVKDIEAFTGGVVTLGAGKGTAYFQTKEGHHAIIQKDEYLIKGSDDNITRAEPEIFYKTFDILNIQDVMI